MTSGGWQLASLPIPTNSSKVSFFFSEDTVGFGPYEGVYVDDIVIAGTDVTPPVSLVGSMPSCTNSTVVPIPFIASDTGGGSVAYVELFFRKGTSGAFTRYAPSGNPSGHWSSSPILFDPSSSGGDGVYGFYTIIATDDLGNVEQAPTSPDATTTYDTLPPSTSLGLTGVEGSSGWYRSQVNATLVAGDTTSGVHKTFFSIDSGAFSEYATQLMVSADGVHALQYYSTDLAGNVESTRSMVLKIDKTPSLITMHQSNGSIFTSSSVSILWACADSTSGISQTVTILDDGTPITHSASSYAAEISTPLSGLHDGQHQLVVRVIDDAGNVAEKSISFNVDTNLLSPTGPMGAIPLVLIVVVLVLVSVVVVHYLRKRRVGSS
ncbi:MAG: Ig-like domain-containing protein [Methanomassiliicoccales archaeon]|nr:Ig-like domain-containing protein [Methanomassiliicoccales archaeon]